MLPQGIPTINSYKKHLKSKSFLNMEEFSNAFIKKNQVYFFSYAKRWVKDPLHHWSRQWEYPFVFEKIKDFKRHKLDNSISVLDAGSGVTFFPYYITTKLRETRVTCLDSDASLKKIFSNINKLSKEKVEFAAFDIRKLPYKDNSYDVIYCISVLEHTKNFEQIIKEFRRVLKKDGLLLITFDISLNGDADIPLETAMRLLKQIQTYFPKKRVNIEEFTKQVKSSKIITTHYIQKLDKNLLPWRHPFFSFAKSLLRLRMQKGIIKNLTFCSIACEA